MSEKTLNHILKSNSDGELLEVESKVMVIQNPRVRDDFNSYPSETNAKLKRTFTLPRNPFRMSTKRKCKGGKDGTGANNPNPKRTTSNQTLNNQILPKGRPKDGESKSKLLRTPSIRKVWNKVVKKVSTIVVNNKTVCADFENRRRTDLFMSQNDLRVPPVKLTFPGDKVPGVIGLRNHGNTCFINAVLQCLTHTDCLAEYFVMNQYKADLTRRNRLTSKKYGTKGEVTEQLALLLKSVWHCQYDPDISNQFKLIVDKYGTQYCGNNQHDAQEFLIWLLDKVHEDLNTATKKNYKVNKSSFDRPDEEVAKETLANHIRCNNSFVHAVFQAQFRSSLTCLNCQRQSNTFDPFLCVSVPIPHNQKRPIYVTVLYISQQPRQVKIGLSLPVGSTVRELREQLASDTGIHESCMLLTQIDDLGFQRTFSGLSSISEIKETDPVYCIEMPQLKDATEDVEKYILLCWVNVLTMDDHCSRFGSPYTMQLCRLTCYQDIQKLILKEMNTMLHDEILTTDQDIPLFRIKIVDGVTLDSTPSYLDPTVDHPLYMEEIDQALALLDEDSGPRHLKLILEWDLQAKESTIADDSDIIEEHSSVKQLKSQTEQGDSVSLEECFELYTRAEVLGAEDKWHCPFCNRKQEVIKKLGLWSLPDILVIHLKRFRQQSCKQRSATKLTMLVDFPLYGFDMSAHMVGPPRDTSGSLALWSPWRRTRRTVTYDDNVYDLYAICNHHGQDLQGGHYTAFCRNPYDCQWYSFDDTKVEPVPDNGLVTNAAYILFYQRRGLNNSSHSSSAASTSSSVSSAEHWVSRMPAFHYPSKKVKSQDDINQAKNKNNLLRGGTDQCKYGTLPSPNKQDIGVETEPDRHSDTEAPTIDPPTEESTDKEEFKTPESGTEKELPNSDPPPPSSPLLAESRV